MANMSIDGLVSGLDTSTLVKQLMQLEANQQTLLKQRLSSTNSAVTALQGINTKAAALATAATAIGDAWTHAKATSSNKSVHAAAVASAPASSITFNVERIAAAHTVMSGAFSDVSDISDLAGNPPTVTLTKDGVATAITAESGSAADMVRAINESDLGVRADLVKVGDNSWRIRISATETGAASQFTVDGLGAAVTTAAGTDALLTLGGGIEVTSASNAVEGLLAGVTLTLTEPAQNVTISVAPDQERAQAAVAAFVEAANGLLADISRQTSVTVVGDKTTGSVLTGESTLRSLQQQLVSQVSGTVGGASTTLVGIDTTRDGRLTFDAEAFAAAYADDPDAAFAVINGIADRLGTVARAASDKHDGSISQLIAGRESTVRDLTDRIESWDRRLETRRIGLERQFSALEVALSKMQSQSNWLASQLANLNALPR